MDPKETENQMEEEEDKEEEKEENKAWETLADFSYYFDDNGELRHTTTNQKFEFNVYKSRSDNQMRYERLGEVVEEHVYKLLEDDGKLLRVPIPIDATVTEGKGFIFRSADSLTCEKLALIIHGSGVVRAGQWARRLIINHSLESGTQLPYIKKARELGFGVLVLNSNQNFDKSNGKRIRGSGSPEEHFMYVWDEFVLKSTAKHVAIVAHSYGGVITTRAAAVIPSVIEKTFAVAFTDSVHYGVRSDHKKQFSKWMRNNVCNWASSSKELDSLLRGNSDDCLTLSAGTTVHEETSWKAFNSAWSFIQKKWKDLQNDTKGKDIDMEKNIVKPVDQNGSNTSKRKNDNQKTKLRQTELTDVWKTVEKKNRKSDAPTDKGDIPMEKGDIPTEKGEIPTEKGEIPTEKGDIPMKKCDIPMKKGEIPTEKGDIPTEKSDEPIEGEIKCMENKETCTEKSEIHMEESDVSIEGSNACTGNKDTCEEKSGISMEEKCAPIKGDNVHIDDKDTIEKTETPMEENDEPAESTNQHTENKDTCTEKSDTLVDSNNTNMEKDEAQMEMSQDVESCTDV